MSKRTAETVIAQIDAHTALLEAHAKHHEPLEWERREAELTKWRRTAEHLFDLVVELGRERADVAGAVTWPLVHRIARLRLALERIRHTPDGGTPTLYRVRQIAREALRDDLQRGTDKGSDERTDMGTGQGQQAERGEGHVCDAGGCADEGVSGGV